MTTISNRIVFSCLSIAGTVGLVSFSNPVAAAPIGEVRQASVFTADLDLSRAAGQATFERRVAAAARQVCDEVSPQAIGAENSCRRNAMEQARRDAGLGERVAAK